MSWKEIRGHNQLVNQFRNYVTRGRMPSTFLFVGPAGIGKRTFAKKLAQSFLCESNPETELEPCGHCPACQQVVAETHPDMISISKPKDRNFIPLEVFIGDREHRMREGLCHDIHLKPFRGGRKIAIIDDADYLNEEGANCLLKTLEEPPLNSMLILVGSSEQKQLPTIRSRCQIVRFHQLATADVAALLLEKGLTDDPQKAEVLASLSQGSVALAELFLDPNMREFREQLLTQLANPPWRPSELNSLVTSFVDAGGKDAGPRRARLRQTIRFAMEFYSELLRSLSADAFAGDSEMQQVINRMKRNWQWAEFGVTFCLDVCLDCLGYIDANATPATIIEYFFDELATITRTGRPAANVDRLIVPYLV